MNGAVLITGRGLVTAAGSDLETFWRALRAGTCFIRKVRHFACPGMSELIGAEVDEPLQEALPPGLEEGPARARCTQLAVAAAGRALSEAELGSGCDPERVGVVLGTTMGEEKQVGDLNDLWAREGPAAMDPDFYERVDSQRMATLVARAYGFRGPALLCASACSSGNNALGLAYDLIRSGALEVVLAGGADTLTRTVYSGFLRLGALSKSLCRPFDKRRDGVCFGEGAGVLVLESAEHARRRGALAKGELAGFGMSNDAYHITAPEPSGDGFARAMRAALESTRTELGSVDYVSAHGTGTPYNDLAETCALKAVFGERAKHVPISSIKSMLGHTNGAASAIEAIACTLAIEKQELPPTANLEEPDPACDLDYVPLVGRPSRVDTCLNLSAGFGGLTVCSVIKKAPEELP